MKTRQRMLCIFLVLVLVCQVCSLPLPTADVLNWSKQEIGVLIHFNMQTSCGNITLCGGGAPYVPSPDTFDPEQLSTDQWMQVVQSFGTKYALLVAQHCSGFSLWPSDIYQDTTFNYTYSVKYSKWRNGKGDVVGDFIASCKKYGIKPGFYYGLNNNFKLNVQDGKVQNKALLPGQIKVTQDQYNKIALAQMKELWTKYGDLFEIWFDGGNNIPGAAELLLTTQPHAVYFQGGAKQNNIRWVGTESGHPLYPVWSTGGSGTGDPNSNEWDPAESDTTLQNYDTWFWKKGVTLRSFADLQGVYHDTVGANSNLIMDLAPDDTGLVPQDAVQRYAQFGDWITKCYGKSLAQTSGSGNKIVLQLPSSMAVDRVIIQEDQSQGQRVRKYQVSANVNGQLQAVGTGSSIGNKRIQLFQSVTTDLLQLDLSQSTDTPIITNFAAYNC